MTTTGPVSAFIYQQRRWLCVLLLGIACALYLHRLDYKPLWWDEGNSIYFSRQSTRDLLNITAADVHPPAYYLALRAWADLTGWSPFAVRLLSAYAGVVGGAVFYSLCRNLLAQSTHAVIPLAATFLSVVFPMSIYRAQEARMYALLQVLVIASWYALLRLRAPSAGPPARWMAAYLLTTVLALYTHYTAMFVLGAQAVFTALTARGWRSRIPMWGLQALAGVLLLLWLIPFLASVLRAAAGHWAPEGTGEGLYTFLDRYLRYATAGLTSTTAWTVGAAALMLGVMIACGLLLSLRLRAPVDGLALTWTIVPTLCMWLVSLRYRYEGEPTRPLLALNSPVLVLAALVGLRRLSHSAQWKAAVLASGGLIALVTPAWIGYYSALDTLEDYRPLVARLSALARPGDAALTPYTWQDGYLASYAPELPLTLYRHEYSPENVASWAGDITGRHYRVWVINYNADVHHPPDPFNIWWREHTALAFDAWYGHSQLALLVASAEPPSLWPARSAFEAQIYLEHDRLSGSVQPGDVIAWSMRWQAAESPAQPYTVFIHLRKPDGMPVAQSDRDPGDGLLPPGAWAPGQVILDRRALLVPAEAPPGAYFIYVGLYDPQTGQRLRVIQPTGCDLPDGVCLGEIEIAAR